MGSEPAMPALFGGAYVVQILDVSYITDGFLTVRVKLLRVESIGVECPVVLGERYTLGFYTSSVVGHDPVEFCQKFKGEFVYLRIFTDPARPNRHIYRWASLSERPVAEPDIVEKSE